MAIVGGLTRGFAKSQRKVAAVSASITGTGAITSGLSSVDAGSAQVTTQNGATTLTTTGPAWVTSISGGTVNVALLQVAAAANAISAIAFNAGLLCTGF